MQGDFTLAVLTNFTTDLFFLFIKWFTSTIQNVKPIPTLCRFMISIISLVSHILCSLLNQWQLAEYTSEPKIYISCKTEMLNTTYSSRNLLLQIHIDFRHNLFGDVYLGSNCLIRLINPSSSMEKGDNQVLSSLLCFCKFAQHDHHRWSRGELYPHVQVRITGDVMTATVLLFPLLPWLLSPFSHILWVAQRGCSSNEQPNW